MKIRVESLRKHYKDADRALTVIDNLSFEFPASKSIAIIGQSGIGKSTLLHILGGLDRPNSGSVFYGDKNITEIHGDDLAVFRGRNVGFIFQFHYLLNEFSALENVSLPLIVAGESETDAEDKAAQILTTLGLGDRIKHRPTELSGGEQQRVAIGRALVRNPAVILADEPTGNLDQKTGENVQEILSDIASKFNSTVIVVTHNLALAQRMDLRLEMLSGGSLRPL